MAVQRQIQFISDNNGKPTGVIVPIQLWREIESEKETAYLLKSARMGKRLLAATKSTHGISLKDARAKLGI